MHENLTISDMWERYEELLKAADGGAAIVSVARLCFFTGADAMIRAVFCREYASSDELQAAVNKNLDICRFVVDAIEPAASGSEYAEH